MVVQEDMKPLSHRRGLPMEYERVGSLATRLSERKDIEPNYFKNLTKKSRVVFEFSNIEISNHY